jgi:hypothetical protein
VKDTAEGVKRAAHAHPDKRARQLLKRRERAKKQTVEKTFSAVVRASTLEDGKMRKKC